MSYDRWRRHHLILKVVTLATSDLHRFGQASFCGSAFFIIILVSMRAFAFRGPSVAVRIYEPSSVGIRDRCPRWLSLDPRLPLSVFPSPSLPISSFPFPFPPLPSSSPSLPLSRTLCLSHLCTSFHRQHLLLHWCLRVLNSLHMNYWSWVRSCHRCLWANSRTLDPRRHL